MAQNGVKHFIYNIIEEKPERFSLSYDRIYLIASVSCKWHYQPKLIHSLLGDSYGCVNHVCGAIDPPRRVEYNLAVICNSAEPNTSASYTVAGYDNNENRITISGCKGEM